MDNSKFIKELDTLGIHLSDIQQEQFDRYYELLIEWNRVMNLTGITAYEEVNLKHFTDSLTIVRINDMKNVFTLIDIGTGAGFPGIPIKIAFPHIKVVLLDSLNKRIKFLNEVVEKLNLDNVETYEKYRAMLKEKSVSDMAARALLAFSELKQNLYAKYISQVEDAFSRNFHSLISKTDLIDGIYIDSAFEVVAYKMQEVDIAYVFKEVQEYGEEYVFTNIGERAYKIIKESSFSDGKITVPIKVEQHFSQHPI